jgi:hypothetical protein
MQGLFDTIRLIGVCLSALSHEVIYSQTLRTLSTKLIISLKRVFDIMDIIMIGFGHLWQSGLECQK